MRASGRVVRRGYRHVIRVGRIARYDAGRGSRTGAPEVVLAEGKRPEHLVELLRGLQDAGKGALVSRITPSLRRALLREERAGRLGLRFLAAGRLARLKGPLNQAPAGGCVAIVTAGTSDVPLAEEARHLLDACGVRVVHAYDVGVAGLHRLRRSLAGGRSR